MSPIQFIRANCTVLLGPLITMIISLLTILDLLWGRKSEVKAQVFPRFWGKMLCCLNGTKVRIEGIDKIAPDQIYIFAGNHCSQYDIFAFQGYFPHDFRWIAKKELFQIPLFGQAMARAGYIPIDRSHGRQALKSLDKAAAKIAAGSSVLIFPEGTRSTNGQLQDFKVGAVLLAIKAGVPIVPIGFKGSHEVLPKGQLLPRCGEIVIRVGQPISTAHYKAGDKQALTLELHTAVAQLLSKHAS